MPDLWSYEKPTEPGMYFINRGDVVTADSLKLADMYEINGELFDRTDGELVSRFADYIKFLKVDIDALNQLGNE